VRGKSHEQAETLGALQIKLSQRLVSATETPGLDAQVLLSHILKKPRAWILAHPDQPISPDQQKQIENAVERLESGLPLPYLLGRWEFYGLEFEVNEATLIPRPETELLVEEALKWLRDRPGPRFAAEVGTGSGCIAIALAVHAPTLQVAASDISMPALEVAAANARRHLVAEQVLFVQTDLLPETHRKFDLICANLPYIPSASLVDLKVYAHEPALALDGGPSGLALIRRLLAEAPGRIVSGGLLLLEIEASQGKEAADLARQSFPKALIEVLPDLAGRDRLLRVAT
jgi:release factor glutamine methyltransferase